MKIETPTTELNTDPLLGDAGYRVQTNLQAGDCNPRKQDCAVGNG